MLYFTVRIDEVISPYLHLAKIHHQKKLNDPDPYWLQRPKLNHWNFNKNEFPRDTNPKTTSFKRCVWQDQQKHPVKMHLSLAVCFFFFGGGGTGNMNITNWVYTCLKMTTHPTWTKSSSLMEKSEICLFLDSRSVAQQKSPNMSDMNMVNMMNYKAVWWGLEIQRKTLKTCQE